MLDDGETVDDAFLDRGHREWGDETPLPCGHRLADATGVKMREVAEGIVADLVGDGSVVGIDPDRASRFDLRSVETGGLPAIAA